DFHVTGVQTCALPIFLTDGAQGLLMVGLAVAITVIFFLGVGAGGFGEMLANLRAQDPELLAPFNPADPITASVWAAIAVTVAHIDRKSVVRGTARSLV